MRREGLRRRLCLAICELLVQHKKTVPNVTRYVVPYLNLYNIRRDQVNRLDILICLEYVHNARAQKPPQFMNSRTSLWADKRRDFWMNSADIFSVSTDAK